MRRLAPVLAAILFLAACTDQGQTPIFEPAQSAVPAQSADRYIVVLEQPPAGNTVAANSLASAMGIVPDFVWGHAINGFAAELTPGQVAALEADPQVAYVEKDQVFTITGNQSPTPSWGLDRIDQDVAGGDPPTDNSYTFPNSGGSGVEVYVFDTGLNFSHNDFTGRTGSGFDATGGGAPNDGNGHGTHVTGTVAGTTYGVAKSAGPIQPVQVCSSSGSCFTSWITNGVNWAIGNHGAGVPAVGNMSLGGGFSSTLNNAVASAVTDGIFMSVSAGNSNTDACNQSPASEPTAHTSGATDINDNRASFSNFGTCVDAFGPGVGITSAWIGGSNASNTISGTSMSSPHHAGIGALHLGINPGDTPAQVDQAIKNNALAGVVNNPGSGSPNLLINMNYLNGAPPPPGDNPPVSDFTWSCDASLFCTFDGSTSSDDNGITLYEWIVNGQVQATGQVVTRQFNNTTTFDLTLRVTDTVGQTNSSTQTVNVAPPADSPPTASIVNPADGSTVSGTVTVQVDATDAEDATGTLAVEVSIDGGAWQAASFVGPYYEFSWDTTTLPDGPATVDARATDSGGNTTNAAQHTVTIANTADAPPVADFTWSCTAQRLCTFDGTTSSDDNGITLYEWLVNGTVRATGSVVQNQFGGPANFNLTLRVTDTIGQTDSQTQAISVP